MEADPETLARRALRFGKAHGDEVEVDEEGRLAELVQLRAVERKEAEKEGVLSSGKTRLDEAKDLVGICPGMISEYQYYWRKLRYNNIHALEKDENGVPRWYLTIKDYARSAAGNEQELPSDVRPPEVLLRTTDYILIHILNTHPFNAVNQAFIRDRARAIVKDFTMQHVRNAPAIDAHERIVRMAALSMHIFRDQRQPDGPFDHDGERKQFVNALSSLTQFYADARTPSLPKTYISQTHISPNEPEFTAYWHLFSLRRPPALPDPVESAPDEYPQALLGHPLFRLARTFVTLYAQSMQLVTAAENLLVSPAERAAKEAREAARGVHRFKRPPTPEVAPQVEGEEDWKPQRFEYPPGFNFPALGLLQRLADPGVPWVLAAVLEASALDDVRARAVWEIWQMRNGGDILVSELVELLGCDEAEDVRVLMDAIIEASGRSVRKLRPKGSDEVRAYRLVGSMKFPSHYPHVRRNVALIDSKRPDIQLSDIVNQPWDQTTNDYDLYIEDVPELELPDTVDVVEEVKPTRPALQGLESSRAVTPAVPGGVFAGFGAVEKKNPFGAGTGSGTGAGSSTLGGAGVGIFGGTSGSGAFGGTAGANPFGGAAKSNPFGAKSNPFGTTSATNGASSSSSNGTPAPTNPFGASASTSPAPTNPFGGAPTSTSSTGFGAPPAPTNPFGNKPTTSGFGAGATAFGAGASGFGAGSNAFGGTSNGFGAGATAFGSSKPTPLSPPKLSSQPKLPMSPPKLPTSPPKPALSPPKSSGSKLSPFAASFVPKFGLAPPPVPAPAPAPEPPAPAAPPEDNAAAEAAKAAREAKLREKLEAAKKEEARARAQEERKKAEEKRRRQEAEEAARREEDARRRREEETLRQMEEAERRQAEAERQRLQAREQLHSTTAQVLLGDILEILVVPEVQYAIQWEKRNRWLVRKSFTWWKARAAKRVKRRRVLENMGLGRVGVAGAAEEVGELFDEEEEEANGVVVRERTRTTSFRETRSDAELAAAMAKAAAERERLWAPGIFLDIVKNAVADTAQENDKPLEDIPGWDVWLCTSGVNQSSAEWLRKKLNARPTQLVDGTVSVASVTPKGTKKDSAPGLVVFECSPYLGAAMTEQEWSDAWSNEANRIARLFSAMSNRASYTPSLLFVVWSTDHVAQHSEAIVRKIKKSASHLADVSIHGEPSVAVLVDETVEEVFQEALSSLELDIEGRPVVELSSVTDSLSRQIASWHRTLSDVLRKIPSFDDEENAAHIAHVINLFFKAFNVMTAGITQLVAPQLENTIRLPDFSFNDVHDNKTLYNLADAYTASLSFPEPVDLNVLRAALRQTRHSSRPFPARFFCERITQLVDVTLTPSISGNRPRSSISAAELAFETALSEAVSALDARTRKRVQETSPVRDSKKARISTRSIPSEDYDHPAPDPSTETTGAAKLRALLAKTRNRWAESDGNDS